MQGGRSHDGDRRTKEDRGQDGGAGRGKKGTAALLLLRATRSTGLGWTDKELPPREERPPGTAQRRTRVAAPDLGNLKL